jgi:transposase
MANHLRSWDKERAWRRRIAAWQKSGLTVRAFCRAHFLSEASFHSWKRTVARRDQEQGSRRGPNNEPAAFVPVQMMGLGSSAAAIEIVVGAGRLLRVSPGFDRQTLIDVLAVLEAPSC